MRWLTVTLLVILPFCTRVSAIDIPDFTPNVVDPSGHLDESARQNVNEELQKIRDSSHILGAVFIVDTLKGESIETVANDAFQKWGLGHKGVDNGLLLVLALKDRKSRFEVGYGLEGVITDVAARHALDDYLAPKMRNGDTEGAIVDAFDYLSQVVQKDPAALSELDRPVKDDSMDWQRGFIAWGVLLVAIWFGIPMRNRWVNQRRARLAEQDPGLPLDNVTLLNAGQPTGGGQSVAPAKPWKGTWFLQAFLSVNPGIFVVLLAARFAAGLYASIVAIPLLALLIIRLSARRYASPANYRRYLDGLAAKRERMIQSGFIEEKAPGIFSYTAAYYASRQSSSSSSSFSSDSSDSSSSSSSDGGSSGGGGASSDW